MAAEEIQEASPPVKRRTIYDYLPISAKIIEVVLAVFAVGLIVDPFNSFNRVFNQPRVKLDDIAFIYITIGGYIVINMIFIISHLLGDRVPKRTLILFASVGALFHVIAGSLIIHDWRKISGPYFHVNHNQLYPSKQYVDMMVSSGVFTLLNALVFIAEIFVTIKYT